MNDEIMRTAMAVVLAWGPERSVPERERLCAAHPELDDRSAESALAEAHRVMAEAQQLAPALKGTGAAGTTRSAILRGHRWLTAELLERAVQQGLYYHWRETGQ